MTVADLHCDRCGAVLAGPVGRSDVGGRLGVRFAYHPGDPTLSDNSGLACEACWHDVAQWLGTPGVTQRCSRCGAALPGGHLVVTRLGELESWSLCRPDTVAFLNGLRTVEPKLDLLTFRFPPSPASGTNRDH